LPLFRTKDEINGNRGTKKASIAFLISGVGRVRGVLGLIVVAYRWRLWMGEGDQLQKSVLFGPKNALSVRPDVECFGEMMTHHWSV